MSEQKESVKAVNDDVDKTADLLIQKEIFSIGKPILKQAIPKCNVTCIEGNEMKTKLSGYLQTLFDLNSVSIGGAMPKDNFYYLG